MNEEIKPDADIEEAGENENPDTLLSLDLSIGDALQLQDTSADNLRYYVKLLGFMNKEGIIVSHPEKDDGLLSIEDGKSFLVRGFSGRKTYEFNANVLASSDTPYPHMHLSFPTEIECMTMRGALRIKPKSLAGWIEPSGERVGTLKMPMIIVDMSTSGARVHSKKQFGNIGDGIKVMFRLPIDGEPQLFVIPAIIRKAYDEKLPDDQGGAEVTTYGLEFLHAAGSVRMALQSYIYKTMAEAP
ncbi:MAG: flagellar brake protein [Gallionella sp.]